MVRFQALMAISMKKAVFWIAALHTLAKVDHSFRDAYCLHPQALQG
jgi:hypothetical protein